MNRPNLRQVLECASPLALWNSAPKVDGHPPLTRTLGVRMKSARGLAHSKTLARESRPFSRLQSARAFTLVEMMVAVGLGSLVLAVVMMLYLFGLRSFGAMGNYAQLSTNSRQSLDSMSRDIRQATDVLAFNTNLPIRSLILATYTGTVTYSWDSTAGVLKCVTFDNGQATTRTNLTGCDQWNFSLFQRTPASMYAFTPTTDRKLCKLISMSWKCSRKILGKKANTEDVMTAQVVIRNMNVKIN